MVAQIVCSKVGCVEPATKLARITATAVGCMPSPKTTLDLYPSIFCCDACANSLDPDLEDWFDIVREANELLEANGHRTLDLSTVEVTFVTPDEHPFYARSQDSTHRSAT